MADTPLAGLPTYTPLPTFTPRTLWPTYAPYPTCPPEPTARPRATNTVGPAPTLAPTPTSVPTKVSGKGDSVLDVAQYAGYGVAQFMHDGTRSFAVWSYDASGERLDLLVNEIGKYDGTVIWHSRTARLEIKADGNWTVEFGE